METIEKGHVYKLISLDGDLRQEITFVRRMYHFGIKTEVHPGATCQDVLRVIHDRVGFLNAEKWHLANPLIRIFLRMSIWLFEYRAAEQRRHSYWHLPWFATHAHMCKKCGHTDCREDHEA